MDDQTVLAAGQPQASLVVREGAGVGTTHPITRDAVILGREEGIDISIRDPEVSRRHARMSWQSGQYYLEDLGSTNGTFLNGTLVTSLQPLQSGDTIGIGQTLLVFEAQADAIPLQPAAAPAYAAPPPSPAAPPVEQKSSGSRCLLWGCGCLILLGLLLIILAALGLALFAQEIQPIFDDLGIPIRLTSLYVSPILT